MASPSLSHGAASASCGRDSVDQEAAQPRVSVPGSHVVSALADRAAEQRHREAVVQHPRRQEKRRRREDSRWQRDSQPEALGDEPPADCSVSHAGLTAHADRARKRLRPDVLDVKAVKDKKEKKATKKEKKGKKDKRGDRQSQSA